jgi:hypothetical protein
MGFLIVLFQFIAPLIVSGFLILPMNSYEGILAGSNLQQRSCRVAEHPCISPKIRFSVTQDSKQHARMERIEWSS